MPIIQTIKILAYFIFINLGYLMFPQTRLVQIMGFARIHDRQDIFVNGLFVLASTLIVDISQNLTLGTSAFAWLLLIVPFFIIKWAATRIYQPKNQLLSTSILILYTTAFVESQFALMTFLNGSLLLPRAHNLVLSMLTVSIVVLLTKRNWV